MRLKGNAPSNARYEFTKLLWPLKREPRGAYRLPALGLGIRNYTPHA